MKIDTLIIIGNGFDRWQGLNTSYTAFRDYYLANRDNIMKRLHIKKKVYYGEDGEKNEISDVELVYGNPFSPQELDEEFWNTFETSLSNVNAEMLNLFFGKGHKDLREMKKSISNARNILQETFCSWIQSIQIKDDKQNYRFGDNCYFINFNYTDTLSKRFGVDEDKVLHIHGEATDKESIIVGHSDHPHQPEKFLYQADGRFRGLYFVEELLYETDKHVDENIDYLCMFLATQGIQITDIKDIYVLGHSMRPPDLQYFDFLGRATSTHKTDYPAEKTLEEDFDDLDELHKRLQYSIQRYGYGVPEDEIDPELREATFRKYRAEASMFSDWRTKEFYRVLEKKKKFLKGETKNPANKVIRTENARWHIVARKQESEIWAKAFMKLIENDNYQIYNSIDACLSEFKINE